MGTESHNAVIRIIVHMDINPYARPGIWFECRQKTAGTLYLNDDGHLYFKRNSGEYYRINMTKVEI